MIHNAARFTVSMAKLMLKFSHKHDSGLCTGCRGGEQARTVVGMCSLHMLAVM
jgi:NADH:ubiquinone oxidoreductase subunit F (NADH-binding)